MINIEDFIKKNMSKLNSEEPSSEHEISFEKKLNRKFHKKDPFIIRYAVAIAASVLIFVATSLYVYITKTEGYTGAIETSQWVEFVEAEQYYSKLNKEAFDKLKETLSAQPEEITSPLLTEFDDMDASYKQLKKELNINPNDIRLMSAVVQYHQLKLDLINNLIERFTMYSNTKFKHNEKSNI